MKARFSLLEEEQIIIKDSMHWKNYLMPMFLLCICTFSLVFRAYFPEVSLLNRIGGGTLVPARYQKYLSGLEMAVLGALALVAVLSMMRISYTEYYITNKRVISVSGIIAIKWQEMLLQRIETVYLNQNAYERLYGCGDILCVAPGSQIFLDDVRKAVGFKQIILGMVADIKKESNGY